MWTGTAGCICRVYLCMVKLNCIRPWHLCRGDTKISGVDARNDES